MKISIFCVLAAILSVVALSADNSDNSGKESSECNQDKSLYGHNRINTLETAMRDMTHSMNRMWNFMDRVDRHFNHFNRHGYGYGFPQLSMNDLYYPRSLNRRGDTRRPGLGSPSSSGHGNALDRFGNWGDHYGLESFSSPDVNMELIHDFPKVSSFSTDIIEKEGHFVAHADLPGMNGKDLKVRLVPTSTNGCRLEIDAKREETAKEEKDDYFRRERQYGEYSRTFNLPNNCDCDKSKVKANYKNGVLEVSVPKLEKENEYHKLKSEFDVLVD